MNIKRAAYDAGYRWARLRDKHTENEFTERVRKYGLRCNVLSFNKGIKTWEQDIPEEMDFGTTRHRWGYLRAKLRRVSKPGLGKIVWVQTPYGHWVRRKITPLY